MAILRNVNLNDDKDIVVQDERFEELENGNVRVASTGQLETGTGEGIQITLENPSGSGVELHIFELVSFANSGPLYPHLYVNPDTGLPTTQRGVINTKIGDATDVSAVLKADTSTTELSGGTDTNIEFGQASGIARRGVFFRVPEGQTVGINIAPSGIGSSEGSFTVWFYEKPV